MMEPNKAWQLIVGKIHNSLDEDEEKDFSEIENLAETKKGLGLARKIHFKSKNSFLLDQIDKERNWQNISYQLTQDFSFKKLILPLAKYAAVFLLAFIVGVLFQNIVVSDFKDLSYNKIEIDWGQMSKMTLSDGTIVWLNAGATLEYPTAFNSKNRIVSLEGEAQFKVVHNDNIPFEVVTETGIVKVYGTTFNVKSYDDDSEMAVTLIEGKVTVENMDGSQLAILNPSEQIIIDKITGETIIKKVDTKFYSSWIDGKILLEQTKLADLVKSLERWYNVEIIISDESIGDIEVSGTIIKGKPIDLFLKILKRMYGVQYELKPFNNKKDQILIYKN
ncbi:FecR family protein [Sunxiuqinia sp. A32]|uniref:FecR family protein n=1 Tax=Sunxiuqinia sp. A32 TaxID=3461496 RepID=UPI0040460BEC